MAAGVNKFNPFSLDEVKTKTNMTGGVNNFNPYSLDNVAPLLRYIRK